MFTFVLFWHLLLNSAIYNRKVQCTSCILMEYLQPITPVAFLCVFILRAKVLWNFSHILQIISVGVAPCPCLVRPALFKSWLNKSIYNCYGHKWNCRLTMSTICKHLLVCVCVQVTCVPRGRWADGWWWWHGGPSFSSSSSSTSPPSSSTCRRRPRHSPSPDTPPSAAWREYHTGWGGGACVPHRRYMCLYKTHMQCTLIMTGIWLCGRTLHCRLNECYNFRFSSHQLNYLYRDQLLVKKGFY